MKNFKRIAAMAAAMTLAACTAAPIISFAYDYTITFDQTLGTNTSQTYAGDKASHTYEAYQIFKGDLTTSGKNKVLSNIEWGKGVIITDSNVGVFVDELKGAETYTDKVFSSLDTTKTAKAIANDIAEILKSKGNDAESVKAFATAVSSYLSTEKVSNNGALTIPEADAGYYLIQDAGSSPSDNGGAKTRYILSVVDNVKVKTKSSAPTVEKKVKENVKSVTDKPDNDQNTSEKWNDVADYSIGDDVPFKIYGTLPDPATYSDYNAYFYQFTDTLGKEFEQPQSVTVNVGNSTTLTFNKQDNGTYAPNDATVNLIKTNKSDAMVKWTAPTATDGAKIVITIEDIKKYAAAGDIVTVEYSAKLSSKAVVGPDGQLNAVKLTYSSNPNVIWTPTNNITGEEGAPTTPDTPDTPNAGNTNDTTEDKVIVFTYELDINKTNGTNKIADAQFTIMAVDGEHQNQYVAVTKDNNGRYNVSGWIGSDDIPTTKVEIGAGKTYTTNDKAAEAGVFVSETDKLIQIAGLDAGRYKITEIAAPDGYNKLDAPIEWTISANTINDQSWTGIPSDAIGDNGILLLDTSSENKDTDGNTSNFVVKGEIQNKAGSTLPSTGGMGTYLFYGIGGAIAIGAGVVLISKKRSKDEE